MAVGAKPRSLRSKDAAASAILAGGGKRVTSHQDVRVGLCGFTTTMRTYALERPNPRVLWEPRGAAWTARRDDAVALCRSLDLVHVVDPFVTAPAPGMPVYWRLHGIGSAHASCDDTQLARLASMVADGPGPSYVLFNNPPRRGDALRFLRMTGGDP
jgi:uncharacterized protein YecE (DUF72 family)